jgi:hypothetical protein
MEIGASRSIVIAVISHRGAPLGKISSRLRKLLLVDGSEEAARNEKNSPL